MTTPEITLGTSLDAMPSTRRAILLYLKQHGPQRAGELATALAITVPAVRQQLVRLSEDGVVAHEPDAGGRGRPAHRYGLTAAGEELFPKRYGDLAAELLGYLGGPASEQVSELFARRGERRLADARARLSGHDLAAKVAELTRILDEDGYLASVEHVDADTWRIVEHNCAILSVASGFRQACSSELEFITAALPEASVARVAHLMDGAHVCAYEVRRR